MPPFTKPRKRTPEEIAQAQKEGNEFIQQREQEAGRIMEQTGISPKAAQAQATQNIVAREQGTQLPQTNQTGVSRQQVTIEQAQQASAQQKELLQKQQEERQQFLPQQQEQKTQTERTTEAGAAFIQQTRAGLGLQAPEFPKFTAPLINPIRERINLAAGSLTTSINIGGFNFAKLFNNQDKNIEELDRDTKILVRQSGIIAKDIKNGADVDEVLMALQRTEDVTRNKFIVAQAELKKHPASLAAGLDLTEEMNYRLNLINQRKQAVERYKTSGNLAELDLSLGTAESQELNTQEITL